MKEALQRSFAKQAEEAAKAKPVAPAKTTPAKTPAPVRRKAATAAPAAPARHWGDPDPGVLKTVSMAPAPAPKAKQSVLDNRMVALAAEEAKRISR